MPRTSRDLLILAGGSRRARPLSDVHASRDGRRMRAGRGAAPLWGNGAPRVEFKQLRSLLRRQPLITVPAAEERRVATFGDVGSRLTAS